MKCVSAEVVGHGLGGRMSYRKARLSHTVRDVVSDAIANHVWDPRVSDFTSVTRVEISPDMRSAAVFVSVMGSDSDSATTMRGLESARGMIQTRLARQLDIRHCPIIRFHIDAGLKTAIDTIRQIDEIDVSESSQEPPDDVGSARVEPEDGHTGPAANI